MNDNIIELNRDVEPFVIQASRQRAPGLNERFWKDKFVPLAFVHASDMHADIRAWNRMVEYANHYSDYLAFILHTGDFCEGSQKAYVDMMAEGTQARLPVYQCTGNHDCEPGEGGWHLGDKAVTYDLLMRHADKWDVTFMPGENSMNYCRNFPESNLRLIVLDVYYDIWPARRWLSGVLEDALEKGLHVITAMHEPTGYVRESYSTNFHTMDDHQSVFEKYELERAEFDFDHRGRVLFEDVIVNFIKMGGRHVCNLCGHNHHDEFGLTDAGVLNVVVANGTSWDAISDSRRVKGTRSYDCFNVVGVDTALGLLKIVRIGDNVDHFMRKKTALCFDYINKKIISSC